MRHLREKLAKALRHLIFANNATERDLAVTQLLSAQGHARSLPKIIRTRLDRLQLLLRQGVPSSLDGEDRSEARTLLLTLYEHVIEVDCGRATLGRFSED